jgi:RNA polymerase sigma-70 factor, ECF subfamily
MLAEASPHAEFSQGTRDTEWVVEARDGSRTAFVALMTRYQDRVYRLAIRMCRNAADAEEIVQETFSLAYRGLQSFQGESRFVTWLYRIAVNQVLMRRRAASRRPVWSTDGRGTELGDLGGTAAGSEPSESTEELVHQKGLTERVREALARLDESHRAALVLRDLEGLTAEESAEILGISPSAVRQRAHRARLKLRELLADLVCQES